MTFQEQAKVNCSLIHQCNYTHNEDRSSTIKPRNDPDDYPNRHYHKVIRTTIDVYYHQEEEKVEEQEEQKQGRREEESEICFDPPPRPASPTSTMVDISHEIDEDQEITAFSSSPRRSVSWKEEIVTDTIFRPKTKAGDVPRLYYNSGELRRFRQQYKLQVAAAKRYQRRLQEEADLASAKLEQQQKSYSNKISSLFSMFVQ
jgi:hypothetical protein